jgi:adenylate cyclase
MELEFPRILVVDDDDDARYTLQLLLEAEGHTRIASASGGRDAIALLGKENFSLILLDIMMPDVTGDQVLRTIKENPATRDIPVVVISAATDTEMISKCIQIGADDYLPKPFNAAILRARISSALRQGSLRTLESQYLARMEQGKRHSDDLLRNMFPPEIAARLRMGESNIADYFEDATVIFADVVGFAEITARMRPYEIVGCINRLFSEFDKLADEVRIEKIRTMGDNYMAVAGLPTPCAGHARAATMLGLDMVAAAERLTPTLPVPFSIRVGIHSGPVMAGVIGTRKPVYDAWGDTVNIASRLEGAGRPNQVLVSSATAKELGGDFSLNGPHRIETKEQRVFEAYFVNRPGR